MFSLEKEEEIQTKVNPELDALIKELDAIDVNQMTPLDALIRLKYLQTLLKK